MRGRIRGRIVAAFSDLRILLYALEDRDAEKIVQTLNEDAEDLDAFVSTAVDDIGFLLYLLRDESLTYPMYLKTDEEVFEQVLSESIKKALSRRGQGIDDVEIDITIERGPRFSEDLNLEEASNSTLLHWYTIGKISEKEYVRALSVSEARIGDNETSSKDTSKEREEALEQLNDRSEQPDEDDGSSAFQKKDE